jgi:hypothetical protein
MQCLLVLNKLIPLMVLFVLFYCTSPRYSGVKCLFVTVTCSCSCQHHCAYKLFWEVNLEWRDT